MLIKLLFNTNCNFTKILGFNSGFVFDYWYLHTCKEVEFERQLRKLQQPEQEYPVLFAVNQTFQICFPKFVGYLATTISQLNQQHNNLSFWLSELLHSRGLSNDGLQKGACFGFTMTADTFNRKIDASILKYRTNVLELVKFSSGFVWVDNFSKIYFRTIWKLKAGIQMNNLFSAFAWCPSTIDQQQSEQLLESTQINEDGIIPIYFWDTEGVQIGMSEAIARLIGCFWASYSTKSLSFRGETFIYPFIYKYSTSQQQLLPMSINEFNVGSNYGFRVALQQLQQQLVGEQQQYIKSIVVDVDLFWRFWKHYFAKDHVYLEFNQHCLVCLGIWHPFKQLAKLIWKKYYYSILAPLFVRMFGKKCHRQPTLSQMIPFFNLILQSYKSCKVEFEKLLSNQLHRTEIAATMDFFHYFLPLVRIHILFYILNLLLINWIDCFLFFFFNL